jgi:putative transcriptional regulator
MLKNTVTKWRQTAKISKAHLARQIGVCRSYVTKLEQGKLQPTGEVMFQIAAYFKVRIEDIFEHTGKQGSREHFFSTKSLPNGNTISKFLISSGQAGGQQTGHSARLSSGNGAAKDKSLVNPTAKAMASPVALVSQKKIK